MTLNVIHRLQVFSNAIRRTFVQHFTRFQLTACSHGSSASAELLVNLSKKDHVTLLPWLPIRSRITRKICILIQNFHAADVRWSHASRSVIVFRDRQLYATLRLHTKFGERAFSFPRPAIWNSLLVYLRTVSDANGFKNQLKTRSFK